MDVFENTSPVQYTNAFLVQESGNDELVETVAVEVHCKLYINNEYWTSTTCSPLDLEDYAYGVLFAAEVITCADDIVSVSTTFGKSACSIFITLQESLSFEPHTENLSSFDFLFNTKIDPVTTPELYEPILPEAIWNVSRSLAYCQQIYRATGATHAAAFADRQGNIVLLREDVGRYNAVDKLIGALLRAHIDPATGFVFLSSRCGLELVAKLSRAGVRVVATVSAPTSAVIDFADRQHVSLCAFVRGGRFTIYANRDLIAV